MQIMYKIMINNKLTKKHFIIYNPFDNIYFTTISYINSVKHNLKKTLHTLYNIKPFTYQTNILCTK